MKIFSFVKKVFVLGLTVLLNFTKFIRIYFNEKSRMQSKTKSC